ncbi:MAG: RHS repeat-associated core domain-containing protein, partial [Planctomycetales bacterium]|nr:RHS repeat-associated core domain-containing protein [Planctomycetales bacterium]
LTTRYLHGPGIDQVLASEATSGNVVTWALADHQGTVRDMVRYASGTTTVVNHRKYDSFGNLTAESDATVKFLYSYTGREWDGDAGLYYYRARWYDAAVGRFISEDPLSFMAGATNFTRYVGNGATNYTDPTGWQRTRNGDMLAPPLNLHDYPDVAHFMATMNSRGGNQFYGTDWLDGYANWFNSYGGSGWSTSIGNGLYSCATSTGISNESLANLTANEALAITTAVSIPTAFARLFGGELVLGVGSASVLLQEATLAISLLFPASESVVLSVATEAVIPLVAPEVFLGVTGAEVAVTTAAESSIWLTTTTTIEATVTFTGTGTGTVITTGAGAAEIAGSSTLSEFISYLVYLGGAM